MADAVTFDASGRGEGLGGKITGRIKASFNPFESGPDIDFVTLRGVKSPGVVTAITGLAFGNRWDVVQGLGQMGATARFVGRDLAKFSVTIKLVTLNDWRAWNRDMKPMLEVLPIGRKNAALTVSHPLINSMGVNACCVETLHQPEPEDTGAWNVTIDFLEYRALTPALSKVSGADPEPPDPNADLQAQLKTLQDQLLAVQRGTVPDVVTRAVTEHQTAAVAPDVQGTRGL